jgi:hypothetical protein
VEIKNGTGNVYNIEKTEGKNIVGSSYLAGNFWAKPDRKGFSETAIDADGDGIADSEYKFESSVYADKLPLVSASSPQQPAVPTANFNRILLMVLLLFQFSLRTLRRMELL